MMLLKPATGDLAAILAFDPQSEFATTLRANIDDARKSAEGLLHRLPTVLCS
jgi:hypothetical protein